MPERCPAEADLLLTCRIGLERVVASYVRELDPEAEVVPEPLGYRGLVAVCGAKDKRGLAEGVRSRVPEVEKVFMVDARCEADLDSIVRAALAATSGRIGPSETFAVRTVRRGKHGFASLDVNTAVGSAVLSSTGASVDLENPSKVVYINVIGDRAFVSLVEGSTFYRKMGPHKYPIYKVFWRLTIAHEPYLGPPDAAYTMGRRVGREVQTFEVGELVVAPIGECDAYGLYHFLRGLFEGLESRYKVQKRSYGREVRKTSVRVQDMYAFVRNRFGQPLIVFEPEGEPISRVGGELARFLVERVKRGKRVYAMVGAREGVPSSVFRFADYVVDVAPGVVISTDYALASALVALATVTHEVLLAEAGEIPKGDQSPGEEKEG